MKKVLKFPELNAKVTIKQEDSPESPRCWDNLGTCLFFHRNYDFGDKVDLSFSEWDLSTLARVKVALEKKHNAVVILPVYMYDHSGQTINTTGFSCPWDSGQLGFIFVTRKKLLKEYGGKRVTAKIIERATKALEGEIQTLDQYIRGDVYGFIHKDLVTKKKDSCWGFYGDTFDNGVFDYLDIEGLTFERYQEVFHNASWV